MSNEEVYSVLIKLLASSIDHFKKDQSHHLSDLISKTLVKINENVVHIQPIAKDFIGVYASNYDVTPDLKANGYRSLLHLLECLLQSIIQTLKNIEADRTNIFFRANKYSDKLELYSDILHQLRALFYYAQILIGMSQDGELFLDEESSAPLMHDCEIMAKSCFYGSLHGFQYASALQPVVHSLSTFVAQYNDLHEPADNWSWIKSAINSGRYVVSPELRGEKLEQVYNGGDVEFFKRFWSLHEQGIAQVLPNVVGAAVQVNRVFTISPEPFKLESCDPGKDEIEISPSFPDSKFIRARLISSVLREGQTDSDSPSQPDPGFDKSKVGFAVPSIQPKSTNLIFFCHGGGFIALTSKSYEFVLRHWSKETDCPIFCVDYSLAPESPFPEAFEECFYAYAWALKNSHFLGTTAEKVVFVGDSAGGNLVLSVALRAGMSNMKVPDHMVVLYPACVVKYSASPARLMSVLDPLLPLGVLSACLGAYSGCEIEKIKRESMSESDSSSDLKPLNPTEKPVQIKFLSNLVKDVHDGLSRISGSLNGKTDVSNQGPGHSSKESEKSPTVTDPSTSSSVKTETNKTAHKADSSSSLPGSEFRVKLPGNFEPLRSKFCGDIMRIQFSSSLASNSYLSPALADDRIMKTLPHVDIMACEFDPLFDDSIVLAKRLERLNKSYCLHVAKQLPHGFLNFQIAKEAREASAKCLELIKHGLLTTKV